MAAAKGLDRRLKIGIKAALRALLELADRVATKHLDSQDLNWAELNEDYLKWKIKHGYSEQIYTMTGTYRGNISIWMSPDGFLGAVGVKRTVEHPDGGKVYQLGFILEYGSDSRGLPARQLWRPTLDEVKPKSVHLFREVIRRSVQVV